MSPDLQYVLSSAVELGEITPMEAEVLSAATPAHQAVNAVLARDEGFPPDFLRNSARAYLAQCDRPTRYVWALKGLAETAMALQFLQERIEFAVERQAAADLKGKPLFEGLQLAELQGHRSTPVFGSYEDVREPTVRAFVQDRYSPVLRYLQEDLDLAADAMRWLTQPGARGRARHIAQALFNADSAVPSVNATRGVKLARAAKKSQEQARSAIKKATALLSKFGRASDLQLLVSGQRVTLSHPDSLFKFELVPYGAGWLEERTQRPGGTAPFEVYLLTKSDVVLSRLCVYFKDTPVLDQLLALTFFVDTGNEQELLQSANWFGIPDLSVTRSVVAEKAPQLLNKLPQQGPARQAPGALAEQMRQLLQSDWDPFRGPVRHWIAGQLAGLRHQVQLLSPHTAALRQLAAG